MAIEALGVALLGIEFSPIWDHSCDDSALDGWTCETTSTDTWTKVTTSTDTWTCED